MAGDDSKKKPEPETIQTIETSKGDAVYKGKQGERLWTVYWERGEMYVSANNGKTPKGGVMQTVHGDIFKNDKPASSYKADRGTVDKANQILVLEGHVQVVSTDPAVTLTCDKLTYEGKPKVMKAKGNVQVTGTMSTVGTLDELWTTADFSKIASPEMFDKP